MRLKKLALIAPAILCGTLFAGQLLAQDYTIADLHVVQPWSRALPPVAKTGAAYLVIDNRGDQEDRLLEVRTPIAGHAELHEHVHQDGLMKMQRLDTLPLPAGDRVSFKPGGYHIMLFDLKQPLNAGEHFPLTLYFAEAGELQVEIAVQQDAPVETDAAHGHH